MSLLGSLASAGSITFDYPFTCMKEKLSCTYEFNEHFNYEDFKKVVLEVIEEWKNYRYGKILLHFRTPVKIYQRKKYKEFSIYECSFFVSTSNNLCYQPKGNKRSGFYVSDLPWKQISKIEILHPDHTVIQEKNVNAKEQFARRFKNNLYDEQTWSHLKPEDFHNGHKFYYISKVFKKYDLDRIQKAFENKETFRVWNNGEKRDYSAEGKMGDDGIYRAWFSSEYSGEGHGDYYMLLNPKVAVFVEHD